MRNYEADTIRFLNRIGVKVTINYIGVGEHPLWKDGYRNRYRVTVSRNGKRYTYTFYNSLRDYETNKRPSVNKPSEYDVLSCVEKIGFGSFEEFCDEYGYDAYSEDNRGRYRRNAESYKIYKAVDKEYIGIDRVFGDDIGELAEICQ